MPWRPSVNMADRVIVNMAAREYGWPYGIDTLLFARFLIFLNRRISNIYICQISFQQPEERTQKLQIRYFSLNLFGSFDYFSFPSGMHICGKLGIREYLILHQSRRMTTLLFRLFHKPF